jgi:hypothetical protein
MECGLWEYVTTKPPNTDVSEKGVKDGESSSERIPELEVKDGELSSTRIRAYSILYLNVSKELPPLLFGIIDPYLAWKTLEKHFRPSSRTF